MSEIAVSDWELKRLDEVADILDNRRVPVNAKERDSRRGSIPYFGATGQVGWIDDFLFDEEIILLGEDGAPFLDTAKQKAYLVRGKSWVNNHAHVLRAKPGVPSLYLKYWLDRLDYRPFVNGTTRLKLTQAEMRRIPVPLPPERQRYEIVAEIEKQFSRLDEAVANLQRVKANLKRYKAAILKAAVEGRLVETEAELARREGRSYETGEQLLQRILEARRNGWDGRGKVKSPVLPETAELDDVPEGWTWASVDQLAAPGTRSITDGPFGSNLKSEHYVGTGPRVIRLQNIKDGDFEDAYARITTEHFEELRKHEVFAGDLVIASLGESPPRACIVPLTVGLAIVKADCIRFKPHSAMTATYLNVALNCQPTRARVKEVLHGIGRPRLSLGEIRAIALPIPPETEQKRIVAEVDRCLSIVREVEAEVDANLKRAQALRQATLSKMFGGAHA